MQITDIHFDPVYFPGGWTRALLMIKRIKTLANPFVEIL